MSKQIAYSPYHKCAHPPYLPDVYYEFPKMFQSTHTPQFALCKFVFFYLNFQNSVEMLHADELTVNSFKNIPSAWREAFEWCHRNIYYRPMSDVARCCCCCHCWFHLNLFTSIRRLVSEWKREKLVLYSKCNYAYNFQWIKSWNRLSIHPIHRWVFIKAPWWHTNMNVFRVVT